MDVRTERNNKVTDLFADTVCFCTLKVNRDCCSRGLSAKCCSISRNLIFDQRERILLADCACDAELDENADQVHQDNNQEYFLENTKDGKSFAGDGHICKSSADVQWQQWDDDCVKDFVNDLGEIIHTIV